MPYIRHDRDENGELCLFVGKERIIGVTDVEIDYSPGSPIKAKITAILGGQYEEETEPGKFAFKEGISNDNIQ